MLSDDAPSQIIRIIGTNLAEIIGPAASEILIMGIISEMEIEDKPSKEDIERLYKELAAELKDIVGVQGLQLLDKMVKRDILKVFGTVAIFEMYLPMLYESAS